MTNILTQLQSEIAALLEVDDWISGTPPIGVVTETLGDIGAEIRKRLGECGMVITVMTPKFAAGPREFPGHLDVTVMLGVGERPRTNRGPTGTQKTAHDVAVSLVAILDRWQPTSAPWQKLSFRDATVVDGPEDMVTWQITFDTAIRVVAVEENNE